MPGLVKKILCLESLKLPVKLSEIKTGKFHCYPHPNSKMVERS
jgi:hypothetical protein